MHRRFPGGRSRYRATSSAIRIQSPGRTGTVVKFPEGGNSLGRTFVFRPLVTHIQTKHLRHENLRLATVAALLAFTTLEETKLWPCAHLGETGQRQCDKPSSAPSTFDLTPSRRFRSRKKRKRSNVFRTDNGEVPSIQRRDNTEVQSFGKRDDGCIDGSRGSSR